MITFTSTVLNIFILKRITTIGLAHINAILCDLIEEVEKGLFKFNSQSFKLISKFTNENYINS